jgi:hypothetical protein
MRISRNKNPKKFYLVIVLAAVILTGSAAAALFVPTSPLYVYKQQGDNPENTVNYDRPTDEQKEAGDKAKEDFIKNHEESKGSENPANQTTNVTISSLTQQSKMLQIRTMIDAIDNSGKCTVTLSRSGYQSVSQSVDTQSLGSYSVCKGFDIDATSIELGEWNVAVDYNGQSASGRAEGKVTIE